MDETNKDPQIQATLLRPTGWLEKSSQDQVHERLRRRWRHWDDVTSDAARRRHAHRGRRRRRHAGGSGGGGREQLASLLLDLLFHVHLAVALLLVAARELPAADVALERLLARVRADVRRQVVAAAERAHADAALERLLARVDADVTRQLVAAGEPAVARLDGASVWALLRRRLARSVRVLPLLHRK